jgi:hypothetical protein
MLMLERNIKTWNESERLEERKKKKVWRERGKKKKERG